MQDYKKLQVWNRGMKFITLCYRVGNELPTYEQFGLRSQVQRAAVSIPTNLAEGSSRKSKKDFARFVEIAVGSAFECETLLLVIDQEHASQKRSLKPLLDQALSEVDQLRKMLYALYRRLVS